MKVLPLHTWNVSVKEAFKLQKELYEKVLLKNAFDKLEHIAGVDVAFDLVKKTAFAAAIAYAFPSLKEVERVYGETPLDFPYVPGLLAFREAPAILKALENLKCDPDVIFFDGQGIAHPRRMGIATHLGIWLDKPTIGCAKSRLTGEHGHLGNNRGACAELYSGEELIGTVLRTRTAVKPVFVSPGHKMDFDTAVRLTLQSCDGYRIPKPTRQADQYSKQLKKAVKMSSERLS